MPSLNTRFALPFAAIALSIFTSSCGDKPELVAQRAAQEAEITKLNGELALLQAKLDRLPANDPADELKKLEAESAANAATVAQLENEITALEGDKKKAEADLADYRAKHPMP